MRDVGAIVSKQKRFFNSNITKSVDFRLAMLKKLEAAIRGKEEAILNALYRDLEKSRSEGYMSEVGMVYSELREAQRHVRAWSRPRRVRGTVGTFPAKSYLYSEPYGTVLIMAPWNYPFNLTICPLVGAIAAGNCAVVKCSKSSVHTSALIRSILNDTFPEEYLYCVDAETDYDEILKQRYDYIFFTGSPRVGKLIMRTASEHLIPVSLELGGKCPCIIDETADLKLAARRIAWGKNLNAGQTCVSVDYVVVQKGVKEAFVHLLQQEMRRRYPDASRNDSYPRIINRHHYERLSRLLETEEGVIGGERNEAALKIAPAILPKADFDHEVMQEEIFGPLLPVIGYEDLESVLTTIKAMEKPLACYVFTERRERAEHVIESLSFGGGCVNDVVLHITNHNLPFGGVGYSGMGCYHGRFGFETFSHRKSIVKNVSFPDIPFRYAPYSGKKLKVFKIIM